MKRASARRRHFGEDLRSFIYRKSNQLCGVPEWLAIWGAKSLPS